MFVKPLKRNNQEKIMKELIAAYANATRYEYRAMADDSVIMKFELVSTDCKSRKVNVFRVGIRGGLRVIEQEFKAND